MITTNSQNRIETIFKKGIKTTFLVNPDDTCEISLVSNNEIFDGKKFAIMTISASSYKLLTIFHLDSSEEMKKYFMQKNASYLSSQDENVFYDAFLEFVNLCCGSINRDLLKYSSSLGMSTPYVLLEECLEFLPLLNPGFVKQYKTTINNNINLYTTLCFCDYKDIDFVDPIEEEEESEVGEMEFF